MNCEQCNSHQENFLAGELTESEKQDFLKHITTCDSCKESLKNTALIWNLVHASCISPADAVLNDEALQTINQVVNEPGALHLKQELEKKQRQQKLDRIKKHKILLQAAAVIVIMASAGIFLSPDIFKSKASKHYLDSGEISPVVTDVKKGVPASSPKNLESDEALSANGIRDAAASAESPETVTNVSVPTQKTDLEKKASFDSLPELPKEDLLKMAKKISENSAASRGGKPGSSNAVPLPENKMTLSAAVPENSRQEIKKSIAAGKPAASPAGSQDKTVADSKTQKKYLQQVVLLPDQDRTVLVYAEMMFPGQAPGVESFSVKLDPVQQAENTVNFTDRAGFMSFYKTVAVSDAVLGHVIVTDPRQKTAKFSLSAKNTVSFEQALPRVQLAFLQQYLADPDGIKLKADTGFLLVLIRAAEKEVNENGENKEEMKKVLSVLYRMVSE